MTERSAVPSSEARMYGVFSNEVRFKGVNLAPKGEGGAEGDEWDEVLTAAGWFYGVFHERSSV